MAVDGSRKYVRYTMLPCSPMFHVTMCTLVTVQVYCKVYLPLCVQNVPAMNWSLTEN